MPPPTCNIHIYINIAYAIYVTIDSHYRVALYCRLENELIRICNQNIDLGKRVCDSIDLVFEWKYNILNIFRNF